LKEYLGCAFDGAQNSKPKTQNSKLFLFFLTLDVITETDRMTHPGLLPLSKLILPLKAYPFYWYLLILLLPFSGLTAQDTSNLEEMGFPGITNYTAGEYDGEGGNWALAQDGQGLMFVGNEGGLMVFDGVNWRILRNAGGTLSRSLAKDAEGNIWGGNVGDVGYYDYDSIGQLQFKSMRYLIPEAHRTFDDVWMLHAQSDTLYFVTTYKLYRYAPSMDSMQVFETQRAGFHVAALVNGEYYIREWGGGLKKMVGDELVLVPGGERFAQTRIYGVLRYDEERLLICTREEGLFLYDGQQFTPFLTEADPYLRRTGIYTAARLPNGQFALGTLGNGLLIIDKSGRLLYKLDKNNGLADNTVLCTFVDQQGGLWAGLESGLSRVAVNSPFTYYYLKNDLSGVVHVIRRFQGRLYVGTSTGVAYLDPLSGRFRTVGNLADQVFVLEEINGELYIGGYDGLFKLKGNGLEPVILSLNRDFAVSSVLQSSRDSNLLFVGLGNGLQPIYRQGDGSWEKEAFIPGTEGEIFNMVEDEDKGLWLGYANINTFRRITFPNWPDLSDPALKNYTQADGVSEGGKLVYKMDGEIFVSKNGTYKWIKEEDRFELAAVFDGKDILATKSGENVWLANDRFSGLIMAEKDENGNYITQTEAFRPMADAVISAVFQEDNGQVWIATDEGLVKYNPQKNKDLESVYSTLIRKLTIGEDSLLYAGNIDISRPIIDFSYNTLQFSFSAPTYDQPERTEYQTRLDGLNREWSSWAMEPMKTYSNLPEGKYTFRVRSRDINGTLGEEARFPFTIPSPWYRQWWAYLLFALLGLGLIYTFVLWRTVRLRKQQEKLEVLVEERTRELSTVNQVSRALSEHLEFKDLIQMVGNQLRDLFYANIVYVALLDKESQMINFPYQHGDVIPPLPMGQGLTSKIIETKKPILINREVDKRYEQLGISQKGKLAASYLGVPIPSGQDVIGVLSVQSTEVVNRFDANDQSLLSTLAAHVGIALHNAQLFEDAKQAKAAAEAANEAKSSFLSTVSHELRTPLTSILGFTKIIQKRFDSRLFPALSLEDEKVDRAARQVKENLGIVISEGERLTTLINDVLDLAKIEAGRIDWNMQKISLQEIVRQARLATSSLFGEKKLKYTEELQEELPPVIGDRDKLIQVMINLLSNAVKFTEKGTVSTQVAMTKEGIRVSVSDTGIGIAPEDIDKVFDKFRQVGDTLTDKPKGTGLGLPICKEIIEQLGGRIGVQSELGKGSTFYFILPLPDPQKLHVHQLQLDGLIDRLKKQVPITAQSAKDRQNQTILVVDDEAPIRELLRQELSEFGYQIETAENGKKALQKIRNNRPDVIILDVMMPELNGFDLAAILKNDPKTMDIPILILSIIQDKERGFRIGVDRYLTKPVDTETLFSEVESLLNQGHSAKKVLVVDENASTVKTISQVLTARGYQVVEADSDELIDKARSTLPDVIILNSLMEGREEIVKSLRFEKGLENVLFLLYQ
jgi:signal transduction histidine kinase/CheY-like chemotaxis protein/ligand-binding sensor domain-containing protein